MSTFVDLMGYQITCQPPPLDLRKRTIVNTINPHSYIVAKRDQEFRQALQSSNVLLPDGIGIVHAARIIKNTSIPRITGPDFHEQLLAKINEEGGSCFYLGSSNDTLAKIEKRLAEQFPNINFASFSPPYKEKFSDEDNQEMIQRVNQFKPDVLFVGMTAPKQEKWVYQNKDKVNANVICSIGAAFDFFSGVKKKPSEFWDRIGLSFLPRFLREPRRLWRRNFVSMPLFLLEVARQKVMFSKPASIKSS